LPHWKNLQDDPRWSGLRERLEMSETQIGTLDFSKVLLAP
jgi:hypothetical protein